MLHSLTRRDPVTHYSTLDGIICTALALGCVLAMCLAYGSMGQ